MQRPSILSGTSSSTPSACAAHGRRRRATLKQTAAVSAAFILCLSLGGCFAEDNDSVLNLGSVSIGQQLTDLKKARDTGAMSGPEYREAKANILLLLQNAALNQLDDDTEASIHIEVSSDDDEDDASRGSHHDDDDDREKEDEGSSFLF